MPASTDVSKHSTYTVDYPSSGNLANSNQQIIFDCQAVGTAFADYQRSWLQFGLTSVRTSADSKLTTAASFGALGSAHNIINEIMVQKGSQVLGRLQNANLRNNRTAYLKKDRQWFQTIGPVSGFAPLDYTNVDGGGVPHPVPQIVALTANETKDGTTYFALPLKDILGFFDQEKLVPGLLAGQIRITIFLAPPSIVFAQGDDGVGPITTYSIKESQIHWRVLMAADEFTRAVSVAAAGEGGLTLEHEETYHTSATSSEKKVNFDVKHNVGAATSLMVVPRLVSKLDSGAIAGNSDSMACAPFDYQEIQHHIGSDYFPIVPLRSYAVGDAMEMYMNEMDAYGALKHSYSSPNVPYGSLAYDYGYAGGDSLATSTTDLLKNDASKWAGYWISANNALACNYTFRNNAARELSIYLSHLKLLKVFPSQIVPME